jgi:hypothetical protein
MHVVWARIFLSPRMISRTHSARPCVAWRAGTTTLFLAPLDCLKIPALTCGLQVEVGDGGRILWWHTQLELSLLIPCIRGLIKYIDTKAKWRHLKKLTYKGTLRQLFICLGPRNSYPPYTLYVYTVYLFIQGRGGELNQREEERGNRSQSWVENTIMT